MSIHMNDNLAEHRILGSPPSSAKPLEIAVLCWSEIWGERMFLLCRYPAFCWDAGRIFYILQIIFSSFILCSTQRLWEHRDLWGGETPCGGWGRCWSKLPVFWNRSPQEDWGNRLSIVIPQTTPNISSKYNSITLIFLPWTKLYYTPIGFLQQGQALQERDWENHEVHLEKNFPSQTLSRLGLCLRGRCHCSHRWPTSLLVLPLPLAESGRFCVP